MQNSLNFKKNDYFCTKQNTINNTIMARPIKETPILYGEDAERFVQQMEEVEARSQEEREESRKKFQERVKEAKKYITFCL